MQEQAIHDPLTGLFNRRYLDEFLFRELQRVIRDKSVLCVCMLDIDHFKNFNDVNGHDAGDEVLKYIGSKLRNSFRGSDIACRYGGEEFIVILVDANLQVAQEKMQKICDDIKKTPVLFHEKKLPTVTISVGISEAPTQAQTTEKIIHLADEALYDAKQAGRDRVKVYGKFIE